MQKSIKTKDLNRSVMTYIANVSKELNVEPVRIIDNILMGFCARHAAGNHRPVEFSELRGKELFQAIYEMERA